LSGWMLSKSRVLCVGTVFKKLLRGSSSERTEFETISDCSDAWSCDDGAGER
jgi:hypothetical protein